MKTVTRTRNTISWMMIIGFICIFPLISGLTFFPKQASPTPNTLGQIVWKQHMDDRFDFSLEIPANWHIDYRLDKPGTIGETLSFYSTANNGEGEQPQRTVITIGYYMYENNSRLPLAEWTDQYEEKLNENFVPSQAVWLERKDLRTVQWTGHQRTGETPLGPVVFTNIQNGNIVWFVWSNIGHDDFEIYEHVVDSLKFGERTPKSLQELYGGEFIPFPARLDNQDSFPNDANQLFSLRNPFTMANPIGILGTDPPGYRLPFTGNFVITCGPSCCSSHTSLPEAIDYGLPMNTTVKSTYNGNVSFFGWKNDTYGNTLTIDHTSSRRSHYSHLDYFMVFSLGEYVSIGTSVASSGDTGAGGAHLHFEVRTTPSPGTGLWIRTLPTTSWYSGDPNNPCWGTADDYDGTVTGP